MIIFENPGEIDVTAITTFGVSVKENENPIGYFGTGLKYAIAILLREGCKITIRAGSDDYEFGIQTDLVRGKSFDFVTMAANGGDPAKVGFTTDVGKNWKLWQAYRELYCNARDESGDAYRSLEAPDPMPNGTQILVTGERFELIHIERWKYFTDGEPDYEFGGIQIQRKASTAYFFRGVRVLDLPRGAMLTYNDTQSLELTEDRSAKDGWWGVHHRMISAIKQSTDGQLLRDVLTAPEGLLEHAFDFHGWGAPPSDQFLRTVGELVREDAKHLNETAKRVWKDDQPTVFNPIETVLTDVQQQTLARALVFCGKIGFTIDGAYPIRVVESLGPNTLGMARDETIYLAEKNFHQGGAKQIAATLIEEFVHLRHGHKDLTRELQNYLLERMVSLGEELIGEPA